MRRWLTIFLLVLMPLQLSWAAAAPYCKHEKSGSAQHFGHHAHQHEHASNDGVADDGNSPSVDNDCPVCHLGCGHLMAIAEVVAEPAAAGVMASPDAPMRSHVPSALERPDRRFA